jgi:hypothetical protein
LFLAKDLSPVEARRCAAETETLVWALILIMLALVGFGGFLFISGIGV